MENEIKVNEYVRLKTGEIFKVDENCATYLNYDPNERKRVKHSTNLIDLIQCGDYVNGHLVIDIPGDKSGAVYLEQITNGALIPTLKEDIQTIVTKEMMESISYKVTKM